MELAMKLSSSVPIYALLSVAMLNLSSPARSLDKNECKKFCKPERCNSFCATYKPEVQQEDDKKVFTNKDIIGADVISPINENVVGKIEELEFATTGKIALLVYRGNPSIGSLVPSTNTFQIAFSGVKVIPGTPLKVKLLRNPTPRSF
jgi:hypothetical protein